MEILGALLVDGFFRNDAGLIAFEFAQPLQSLDVLVVLARELALPALDVAGKETEFLALRLELLGRFEISRRLRLLALLAFFDETVGDGDLRFRGLQFPAQTVDLRLQVGDALLDQVRLTHGTLRVHFEGEQLGVALLCEPVHAAGLAQTPFVVVDAVDKLFLLVLQFLLRRRDAVVDALLDLLRVLVVVDVEVDFLLFQLVAERRSFERGLRLLS